MRETRQTIEQDGSRLEQILWTFSGMRLGMTRGVGGPGSSTFQGETEKVRLHFNVSGGYDFDYHQLGKSYRVKDRQHNLMYSPEFEMKVHRRSDQVETFGIQIEREVFLDMAHCGPPEMKRLADAVASNKRFMAGESWGGDDPFVYGVIHDIMNCKMQGPMKTLLIESKAMELVMNQVHALQGGENKLVLPSRRERDQLYAARTFLMDRLQEPPRLREVSLAIGLNEFKLKRGFKALFGSSVGAFLQRERLRLAARWMEDPKASIAAISFDLGYSSPQHLSRAFRKFFGSPPRNFRKERLESGLYTFLP